uniref:Fibronectin type-II domain-containing protein n=1 Tax=Scleropages formosus TaxID=113540 RepID=A0A8D0CLB6_SCLFO
AGVFYFMECCPTLFVLQSLSLINQIICSCDVFLHVILLSVAESSCVFPFTVGGKTYNRCTTDYWLPGIPWCSTTANYDQDKQWSYCPSSEYDISPNYCVFPFKYNGQLYFSCTSVDSKHERLWCSLTSDYDQDRLWESSCVFPFTVGGKTYNRCTTDYWLPGIPWCSTTANYDQDKKWSYCPSSGIVLLPGNTGSKSSCVFPFTVGGKTYNRCTTDYWFPGISWCSTTANYDQDKKWVYCPSSGIVLKVLLGIKKCIIKKIV